MLDHVPFSLIPPGNRILIMSPPSTPAIKNLFRYSRFHLQEVRPSIAIKMPDGILALLAF